MAMSGWAEGVPARAVTMSLISARVAVCSVTWSTVSRYIFRLERGRSAHSCADADCGSSTPARMAATKSAHRARDLIIIALLPNLRHETGGLVHARSRAGGRKPVGKARLLGLIQRAAGAQQ